MNHRASFIASLSNRTLNPVSSVVVVLESPTPHQRGRLAGDGRQISAERVGPTEVGQGGQLPLPAAARAAHSARGGGRRRRLVRRRLLARRGGWSRAAEPVQDGVDGGVEAAADYASHVRR